jgi:antitoxin (DNA-binding transcriptional repressor) of toxin-antitoxin stability system
MAELAIGSSHTYTMRDLNHRTADVIREINESGRPAAITRHGRFVALITPLANANVEAAALAAAVEATEHSPKIVGDEAVERAVTPEEAARELDVNWRSRRGR